MSTYEGPAAEILTSTETALASALAEIEAISDPVTRELAARHLGETVLREAVRRSKVVRTGAVLELKQGRSFRQVGEMLGLSTPRVDQLAKGR